MSHASHILGLVDTLSRLEPDALARTLTLRNVPFTNDYTPVGLARALTQESAIRSHLSQLTAEELRALGHFPAATRSADQPYIDQLLAWSDGVTTFRRAEIDACVDPLVITGPNPGDAGPAESAAIRVDPDVPGVFGQIELMETLLAELGRTPVSTGQKNDRSELSGIAKELGWDLDDVASLVDAAIRRGYLAVTPHTMRITPRGLRWRNRGAASKWLDILQHWRDHAPRWWPRALPATVSRESVMECAIASFPLVSLDGIDELVDDAARWGLTKSGAATTIDPWDPDLDEHIRGMLPSEATALFPDGPDSVIATGPLSDEWEARVRSFSDWISGSLAPRFRISPRSVCRALQRGVSPDELAATIAELIPPGMGNVISEMVADTIARASMLSLMSEGGHCFIRSGNELTLALMKADRRLAAAGISERGNELYSPWSPEDLHELLLDENYPHLVFAHDGSLLPLEPVEALTCSSDQTGWSAHSVSELIDSLRDDSDGSALIEAIELAITEKCAIAVTVTMNDGPVTMRIEPHALKNGRLRGLDTRSDVERTIPMSHVLSVTAGD